MNRGKFLKEWQVTDKIIEWIFQFIPIHIQPFIWRPVYEFLNSNFFSNQNKW